MIYQLEAMMNMIMNLPRICVICGVFRENICYMY